MPRATCNPCSAPPTSQNGTFVVYFGRFLDPLWFKLSCIPHDGMEPGNYYSGLKSTWTSQHGLSLLTVADKQDWSRSQTLIRWAKRDLMNHLLSAEKRTVWIDYLSSFALSLEEAATHSHTPWWPLSSSWIKVPSATFIPSYHSPLHAKQTWSPGRCFGWDCFNTTPNEVEEVDAWLRCKTDNDLSTFLNAVHTHIYISDHISLHEEFIKLCFNVTPATVEWISTENFCPSGCSNQGCWWMQQFHSLQQMGNQSWQLHIMPLHVHWERKQRVAWGSSF